MGPRYGEKTFKRVKSMIELYDCLLIAMKTLYLNSCIDFDDKMTNEPECNDIIQAVEDIVANQSMTTSTTLYQVLQLALNEENRILSEKKQHEEQQRKAKEEQMELESKRIESQMQAEEEKLRQLKLKQEQEVARKANASRQAKQERIDREKEREKQKRVDALLKDKEFMASVTKGDDGVRMQLEKLHQLKKDIGDREYKKAIQSLQKIFQQIISHPEDPGHRFIRRENERFHDLVGKHKGGCELLIAAGFKLVRIQTEDEEDVPFFIMKEPNIEADMDGWSNWYDGLKSTLNLIEDTMPKK